MRVRELTTVVRTIAKIIVMMTREKIHIKAIFRWSLIWAPHSMLIGISMTGLSLATVTQNGEGWRT
jgi:hypothetical protein